MAKKKTANESLSDTIVSLTSTTDTRGILSLSAQDRVRAIENLSRQRQGTNVDDMSPDWVLALTAALFEIYSVRLEKNEFNHSGTNVLRFSMKIPLGRHTFEVNTSSSGHMLDDETTAVLIKKEQAKAMIHDAMKPVERWVDIAKNAHKYDVKDILELENIEQRMAALRIFGADKLIDEAHAELISESKRGNMLYRIPAERELFRDDAFFLRYQCVSTGRIYVSGVPASLFDDSKLPRAMPTIIKDANDELDRVRKHALVKRWGRPSVDSKYNDDYIVKDYADLAMAWKFNLTLEEYKSLKRENEA